MFSIKSGRVFVAAALVAASFFLAVPAEAADSRGGPPGLVEMAARVVGGLGGWFQGVLTSMTGSVGAVDHEGGYLDPNGGGRPGSCGNPAGCEGPPPPPTTAGGPA